jgi:hypothetical protein
VDLDRDAVDPPFISNSVAQATAMARPKPFGGIVCLQ